MRIMNIYVSKDGQQHGPFTMEQIENEVRIGTFQPTDFAWREGMADWVPLNSLFQMATVDVDLPERTTLATTTESPTRKKSFPLKTFIICIALALLALVSVSVVYFFNRENPTKKIERFTKGIKNVDGISISDLSYDVKRTDSTVTKFVSIIKGTASTNGSTARFVFQANYQDGKWIPSSNGVDVELTGGKEYDEIHRASSEGDSLDRLFSTRDVSLGVKNQMTDEFNKRARRAKADADLTMLVIGSKLDDFLKKSLADFK